MSDNPPPDAYFPIFLSLTGQKVLVVGHGEEALTKLRALQRAGAAVTLAGVDLIPDLAGLPGVTYTGRGFCAGDLAGMRLCIVALEDAAASAVIVDAARQAGVLVNAVDKPALCDFIVPAVVDRAPVTVAISTGGASPALARDLRSRVEAAIPAGYGALARLCRRWRQRVARALPDRDQRRRFWDEAIAGAEAGAVLDGDAGRAEELLGQRLEAAEAGRDRPRQGRASLVGAGPGDPELLTLRAMRAIGQADIILYDQLVGPGVLDLARRDARRIDVGKRCGRHALSQAAINRLIISHAKRGDYVVRLKGGDPFIFGRGGEELASLRAAGVPVDVVPGITAACAAASSLGIPLTHRGMARALHFVTGHGRDNTEIEQDWPSLARSDGTIAVYMGAKVLDRVTGRLLAAGMAADTPAVAIENASLPSQKHYRGNLGQIAGIVADAGTTGPVLVLLGAVVGLGLAVSAGDARVAA